MKKRLALLVACFFMLILMIDSKTSITGAATGIDLCLRVAIPSLFPFIFLTTILSGHCGEGSVRLLRPLCKPFGIPEGAESMLLLGLAGGYPVGAASIALAYQKNRISKKSAKRMLGFCNNAGPSFIFGMLSGVFTISFAPLLLWCIQILSSLTVGFLLPAKRTESAIFEYNKSPSISDTLMQALRTTAGICGWVILFRILCSYLDLWLLRRLPPCIKTFIFGFLELTNGCAELSKIPSEPLRFIICSILLSCGGICVAMQTVTVSGKLGTGMYFPGKLFQILISGALAFLVSKIIFP